MASLRRALVALVALSAVAIPVAGCSASADDGAGEDEGAATLLETDKNDYFGQAQICDQRLKAKAAFREVDLAEGVMRWVCGDVAGVTQFDQKKCDAAIKAFKAAKASHATPDKIKPLEDAANKECGGGFGQEYCEYHAVQRGAIVDRVEDLSKVKSAELECLFTSVYSDVKDDAPENENNGPASLDYVKRMGVQLTASGNLANASGVSLDPQLEIMQGSVNSRGAATTLVVDCMNLAAKQDKNAERQAACYTAWASATDAGDKSKLEKACRGVDLSKDAAYSKLTKIKFKDSSIATKLAYDAGNESMHDIAACVRVKQAEHGGVGWRNSDPTICGRSLRAAECGDTFNAVPDWFDGFEITGWANRTLPAGCRYAKVDGKDYTRYVICKPAATDVDAAKAAKKPLQALCNEKFGPNLAMQAPLGLLANAGPKNDDAFCSSWHAGSRKIHDAVAAASGGGARN